MTDWQMKLAYERKSGESWENAAPFVRELWEDSWVASKPAAPSAEAAAQRIETTSENIARDIREGRFPQRSEPQMVASAAAPAQSGEPGYAFRSDGKLWVVTDPDVAAKWREQGFEVTPVAAPQPAQPPQVASQGDERAALEWALFSLISVGHHEWAQRHRKVFEGLQARAASPKAR